MQRYGAYKDSGVEWIGEIPEAWEVRRANTLFYDSKERGEESDCVLSATQDRGVIPKDQLESVVQNALDADLSSFKKVRVGDYIISLRSFQGGLELAAEYEGRITPAYTVVRPMTILDSRYFKYAFKEKRFIQCLDSMTSGIREGKTIRFSEFRESSLPLPPLPEQQAIADYLDEKTAEIDSIVSQTERSIGLLREYRKSVISEAVTKGLDPDAPVKDSGVNRLGLIPCHWMLCKVKHAVTIENGSDPKTEGEIPVFGSGEESFKTCGEHKEGPTVLLGRKGATLDVPHYIDGRYWNVDTAFNTVFDSEKIIVRFFYYLAVGFDYWFYTSHTTLPSMTQTAYGNMEIPLPPLPEQQAIADYLDEKTAEIDSLIGAKQRQVELLKEYRKSLISEAVTGKFKVPGLE